MVFVHTHHINHNMVLLKTDIMSIFVENLERANIYNFTMLVYFMQFKKTLVSIYVLNPLYRIT